MTCTVTNNRDRPRRGLKVFSLIAVAMMVLSVFFFVPIGGDESSSAASDVEATPISSAITITGNTSGSWLGGTITSDGNGNVVMNNANGVVDTAIDASVGIICFDKNVKKITLVGSNSLTVNSAKADTALRAICISAGNASITGDGSLAINIDVASRGADTYGIYYSAGNDEEIEKCKISINIAASTHTYHNDDIYGLYVSNDGHMKIKDATLDVTIGDQTNGDDLYGVCLYDVSFIDSSITVNIGSADHPIGVDSCNTLIDNSNIDVVCSSYGEAFDLYEDTLVITNCKSVTVSDYYDEYTLNESNYGDIENYPIVHISGKSNVAVTAAFAALGIIMVAGLVAACVFVRRDH